MKPDDERLPDALTLAQTAGMLVEFAEADLGEVHPNTARFDIVDADGRPFVIQGSSLGGGTVAVTLVDDFPVEVTGELPVLVVIHHCLLYTSDAADEEDSVDLGGRRIIKKQ